MGIGIIIVEVESPSEDLSSTINFNFMVERPRKALILGAEGQDGNFLSKLLQGQNYQILRTVKSKERSATHVNCQTLDIRDTSRFSALVSDFAPDEIYNLAGISSVSASFKDPALCMQTNSLAVKGILEVIRNSAPNVKFYHSSSSEMFGNLTEPADETTMLNPLSPYGEAKAQAHLDCGLYRTNYGIQVYTGILFNHESEFRPRSFVTRKITSGLVEILCKNRKQIELGDVSIVRDWGYASDHVAAMHRMISVGAPGDYIVGTGISHTLEDFIRVALNSLDLPAQVHDYVSFDPSLVRVSELKSSYANPNKMKLELGWRPQFSFQQMVEKMIHFDLKNRLPMFGG